MSEWIAGGRCDCDTPPGESAPAPLPCNTITMDGDGGKKGSAASINEILHRNKSTDSCENGILKGKSVFYYRY